MIINIWFIDSTYWFKCSNLISKLCLGWMTSDCSAEEENGWCLAGGNSEKALVIYVESSLGIDWLWNKSKTCFDIYGMIKLNIFEAKCR